MPCLLLMRATGFRVINTSEVMEAKLTGCGLFQKNETGLELTPVESGVL